MGTSLSGLTPATTFDGLLKVGDNDPLTADLKAISTGDGTDTILSLSNSALSIGGSVTANEVFAGTSGFTFLRTENNARAVLRTFAGDGKASFYNAVKIGDSISPTAQLHIKGSGATSATTSLLVQNSSGNDLFSIKDNGLFTFNDDGGSDALTIENGSNISQIRYNDNLWLGSSHGTYVPTLKIDRLNGLSVETNSGSLLNLLYDTGNLGIGETTPTARLHVKGSGNSSATNAFFVENSTGNDLFRVVDNGLIYMSNDNYIFSNSQSQFNNKLGIGTTPDSSTQLHVKGSGNDNTTTSLLVQNSDATELLKINDDGEVFFGDVGKDTKISLRRSSAGSIMGSIEAIGNGFYLSGYQGNSNILFGRSSTEGITINNGQTRLAASLGVKGLGATSATTALLVQNSAGADMLKVQDDSSLLMYRASNGAELLKIGESGGNAILYANGNSNRSLVLGYQNTLTAFNQTEFKTYNGTGYSEAMVITGNSNTSQFVGIGETTPTAKLHVKGAGATSATDALLVQNSGGADLLKVVNDGTLRLAGNKSVRFFGNESIEGSNQGGNHIRIAESSFWGSTRINAPTNITEANAAPDASAILQADSTTQGFLPPRMTDAERDAITTPAAGLMIYDTSNNQMNYWNGSTWIAF